MKKITVMFILMIFMVTISLLGFVSGSPAQERILKPTLIPMNVQTPAPTPEDNREIAILTLMIESDREGKILNVSLEKARIIRGYAPNVLERSGPWMVEVVGDKEIQYGVQDPRWREVFATREREKFESELLTEVTWDLVVPLYLFDRDLNAREILIRDQRGEIIFATEVNREAWK